MPQTRWEAHNQALFTVKPRMSGNLTKTGSGQFSALWLGVYVHAEWGGLKPLVNFWTWHMNRKERT